MPISNEDQGQDAGWDNLIRLQSEYQARLTEETLKYLRSLQAVFSPRPPGTVVRSGDARLVGAGHPGGSVHLDMEIENRQRVHTPATPAVSPMVGDGGTTWYPDAAFEPSAVLLEPDASRALSVTLPLPVDLPPDVYRGSLTLQGFRVEGVPVEITVTVPVPAPRRRTKSSAR